MKCSTKQSFEAMMGISWIDNAVADSVNRKSNE